MTSKANRICEMQALVVDDDADLLKLMRTLLQGIGVSCGRATNGEAAMALLKSLVFDLLIVDKNLPGMDGIEVARRARVLQPDVITLIITGYASETSAHRAATAGVSDYITKPIDAIQFRQRVTELLRAQTVANSHHSNMYSPRSRVVATTTGPPWSVPLPAKWIAWKLGQGSTRGKGAVSVLLIEPDAEVRECLIGILTDIYCEVIAFPTTEQAEFCASACAFDVLVAHPEILTTKKRWLARRESRAPLGSLAILEREGIEQVIKAIQTGARGALAPPFDRSTVASKFTETVTQLIDERYGT